MHRYESIHWRAKAVGPLRSETLRHATGNRQSIEIGQKEEPSSSLPKLSQWVKVESRKRKSEAPIMRAPLIRTVLELSVFVKDYFLPFVALVTFVFLPMLSTRSRMILPGLNLTV